MALSYGARTAQPGEFTKRAYLNKKVDLVQAESINDLIHAQTSVALKKSQAQLQGSLSAFVQEIEKQVTEILSFTQASFEFLEEEHDDLALDSVIGEKIVSLQNKLAMIKTNFTYQQRIKDGIKIAIVGSVNAGKSTLFNALVGSNRAIVTPVEGTTRDTVEHALYKNGNYWSFVDTAGIRETDDFIEQQGIQRSLEQAAKADIVLLVFDTSCVLSDKERLAYFDVWEKHKDKVILVANKIDIARVECQAMFLPFGDTKLVRVAGLKRVGIADLEKVVQQKIAVLSAACNAPFLLNQRQYDLLMQMKSKIDFVVQHCMDPLQYELIAYHITQGLESLSEMTGKNVTESILDNVFSQFCVGK